MWPLDLYNGSGVLIEAGGSVALASSGIETYQALGALERAGAHFGATLVLAMVVLGLLQGRGPQAVRKCRRSPVISLCIGLPSLLVVGGLASGGYVIIGTSLGTFPGVILVTLGVTVLSVSAAVGFVAIGTAVAARIGRDRLWAGVLIGSVCSGLAGLSPETAVVAAAIAGALGVGAGVRVLRGAGGATQPSERTVPPANKI